ncbi:MAG: 1-acyl-sn-glycerol-3-phosphate acyltransferase [Proteobacteria bacterium]|nr:1-acyl-sn-glycerol-3-phosphate acyltransferase [Pseudomonadota bacterium]
MQPITQYERPLTERALMAIHPFWSLLARVFPGSFGQPREAVPHPSAMLESPNRAWRLLLPHFFRRVSVDPTEVRRLAEAAAGSTVIYIAKYAGQLEYSFFNHLFLEKGLPLSRYTNSCALRRWMKAGSLLRSVSSQESQIGRHGRILDPLYDGYLPQMVSRGESALIRIPPIDLLDEELVITGPLRALLAIIEAQRASERPVKIVPLDFLWSRRPPKAKRSVGDIFLGEQESPGAIRKFFLFWKNYRRRAHASIGEPISVSEFIAANGDASDDEELASRMRKRLLGALNAQRRTVIGPPLRPRSWFIQQVLSDEELDNEVCRIAADRRKPADDLRDLAHRYAREIVADLDYAYVEILERVLGRALTRLFESLDVDEEGLAAAKAAFAGGPVIFVPNHRSHVDGLVLSYVFYHAGMTIPHIAAGSNLSFWPLGRIFRRCGAYFIRRAFRDNPLYKAVLATYLKVMMKEGICQEFFIEGGRTRTGKLKDPKMGMLGMMKRAAREAGVEGASIVPVSITYDRVIEQKGYASELEGAKKKEESRIRLVGLTRYLGGRQSRYGSIHVRFGPPMPLLDEGSDPKAVERCAWRICHEINRRAVVTPAAVAAAAILPVSRTGLTLAQFRQNSQAIVDCLIAKGAEVPAALAGSTQAVMQEALATLARARLVTPRTDSLEPFIAVDEEKRVPLSIFRNSLVHFLVTPAVLCKVLLWRAKNEQSPSVPELADDLAAAKLLLHHEFRFAASRRPEEHVERSIAVLEKLGAVARSGDGKIVPRNSGLWICDLLSAQVRPFVETLWVAARYVEGRMKGPVEERPLIDAMLAAGSDMYQLGRVRFRESINRDGYAASLRALVKFGMLVPEPQKEGQRRRSSYAPTENEDSMKMLKVELEKLF